MDEIDLLAASVLRGLEEIDHTLEARLPRDAPPPRWAIA
jgi:hypothetical protein